MRKRSQAELLLDVGRRIAELRREHQLTQSVLAERMDVADARIRQIESGRVNVSLRTLHAVSVALDVDVSELFVRPTSRALARPGRPRHDAG